MSKQTTMKGMPEVKGAAKIALEWLRVNAKINVLNAEKNEVADRILKAMKKEKRDLIKVQDPDTQELKKFEADPGEEKLRVRKVPVNVGENT